MDSGFRKTVRLICLIPALFSLSHLSAQAQNDADLDHVPFPVKYAHPHTTGITMGMHMNPTGTLDAATKQRYLRSQELEDRGMKEFFLKRDDAAIISLNTALTLRPNSENAYRWLAEVYADKGQIDKAIAAYRHLFYGDRNRTKLNDIDRLNDYQTDPTLLMQFSLLLLQTNQYPEALAAYQQGIDCLSTASVTRGELLPPREVPSDTSPQSLEASVRTALAISEISYRDNGDASSELEQAIRLRPGFGIAYFHKGELLKWEEGKESEALAAYRQAVQYDGVDVQPYLAASFKDAPPHFIAAANREGLAAH
jgi:tetratricopeptide (TPR) repeat protein